MIHCREEMVEKMVAECCIDQRFCQRSKPALGLVHVPGGVQHVEAPVPVRPQLVPSVVELRPMVGGGLLYDEHVPGHGVDSQPELGGQQGLVSQSAQEEELGPGQEVLGQELVLSQDDEVVTEEESCGVGEHSEHLRHHVLAPGPHHTLRHRQVKHEGLHAGDLQVSVGVGVEVVGQGVADLFISNIAQGYSKR